MRCAVIRRVHPLAQLMLGGNVHSSACDHSANTCMAGKHASHTTLGQSRSFHSSMMPRQVSQD